MSVRNKIFTILLVIVTVAVIALVLIAPPKFLGFTVPEKAPKDNAGEAEASASAIVINEFMPSNSGAVVDEDGDSPEWFELYNAGSEPVSLAGYTLTNNPAKGPKFVFSNITIPSKGHLLIFAPGSAETPDPGELYPHVPFKLKQDQTLLLADSAGGAVDSVSIPQLTKNHSVGRSPDGSDNWIEFAEPTPGFPNDEAGRQAYLDSLKSDIEGLYISELMASNHTTLKDKDGDYSDWVELYNATDKRVDLSGFALSDKPDDRMRCRFPQGTAIEPGEYLLVFASGKSDPFGASEELHAPFRLSSYEGAVLLCDSGGKIIDSVDYAEMAADQVYARVEGAWEYSMKPTPSYENSDAGYEEFMKENVLELGPLTINEVMASNDSLLETDDEKNYDWIELRNASSETLDISGYGLSDNTKNPVKWRFPQGASIEGGGYLVVLCSGQTSKNPEELKKKYYEAGFKLSLGGEIITLSDPGGNLIDRYALPKLPTDISYGRSETQMLYYDAPTPGAPNGEGFIGITSLPSFSEVPGVYENSIEVSLKAGEDETIYYTTDCTTPTAKSERYSGPITVGKNTVIRAVTVRENYINGPVASGTFLLKSDGANHALPIVSLVTDPKNLWDSKTGIYAYGDSFDPDEDFPRFSGNFFRGKAFDQDDQEKWEREASFSVFGDDGRQTFAQNVGIRIAGYYGRGNAQKGLNIIARSQYGPSRMAYPFFDNRDYASYKSLALRAGGQDQPQSKIRDELSVGLLEGTDVNILYQAYKPYVLYLNGEYWGVYFLKEKRNRFLVAQRENVSPDSDFTLMKSATQVNYGSAGEWKKLMEYVAAHDLSNSDAYEHVASEVDLNSFMDYMICEIYVANSDTWNIQYYKLPGGKWKWIYYDFCWSWGNSVAPPGDGAEHQTLALRRRSDKPCSDLFNALLKNKGWKDAFVRRMAELFKTVYAPGRVNALVDELVSAVQPELEREREKFNSSSFKGVKQPAQVVASDDVDKWLNMHIKKIRDFANNRQANLKQQLKSELGLSEDYIREVFGE